MHSPTESNSIVDIAQAQFQASLRFADTMFSGIEKIDQVLLDNAHQLLSDELHYAHTLVAESDSKVLANKPLTYISGTPDAAMQYQGALFHAYLQIQKDLAATWQQYAQQVGEQFRNQMSIVSASGKRSNTQPNIAEYGPFSSMLSAWQSAWLSAWQSTIPAGVEPGAQAPVEFGTTCDAPSPAARPGRHHAATDQRRNGPGQRQ